MDLYASRTGTKRNLDGIRARGWRLLVSATGVQSTEGFDRYALDNGAWTAYQRARKNGGPVIFDEAAFDRLLLALGEFADWCVVPDIVGGGLASLRLSLEWMPRVHAHTRVALLAVQEGIDPGDIAWLLGPRVGIFVGGADDLWKEQTAAMWAQLARRRGAYCHVGRVNTQRRIWIADSAGADSIDGTSASLFQNSHPLLSRALAQKNFVFEENPHDDQDL